MTKWLAGFGALLIACLGFMAFAYADSPLRSPNYEIDESFLGGSGLTQSNSTNFQVGESISDIGAGNSASANYQSNAGYTTTSDPALAFAIGSGSASFGSFSASAPAVATSSFQVSNYTSYGYVVQIVGSPPANGSHVITAMSSTGVSSAGTEQFGINLVANTSPVSFGANPVQGIAGAGVAAANYGTANHFRYVSGETIASAPRTSGLTTYTISYLINVNSLTPGGQYTSGQTLVCTGTY